MADNHSRSFMHFDGELHNCQWMKYGRKSNVSSSFTLGKKKKVIEMTGRIEIYTVYETVERFQLQFVSLNMLSGAVKHISILDLASGYWEVVCH